MFLTPPLSGRTYLKSFHVFYEMGFGSYFVVESLGAYVIALG